MALFDMTQHETSRIRVVMFGLVTAAMILLTVALRAIDPFREHPRLVLLAGAIVLFVLDECYFHVLPSVGPPPWKRKQRSAGK
jgi:hypothetical protein